MMAFSREWDRSVDGSLKRLDAMSWGITRLSKIIKSRSPNRPGPVTCGAIEIAGAKIFPQGRERDGESRHRNYLH
jgi:hypothetical protein